VGVAESLQEALDQVFQGDAGTSTGEGTPQGGDEEPAQPSDQPTLAEVLAQADAAFDDADAAAREGRWADYGEAIERLRDALAQANQLSAAAAPTGTAEPTPTATPEPTSG
jgi:uncharacterized membrane protein (UPF0182 family)